MRTKELERVRERLGNAAVALNEEWGFINYDYALDFGQVYSCLALATAFIVENSVKSVSDDRKYKRAVITFIAQLQVYIDEELANREEVIDE